MIMRQEMKIGEIFECNGEKVIVKKIAILCAVVINAIFMLNRNVVIIIAFLMLGKTSKMYTLKK